MITKTSIALALFSLAGSALANTGTTHFIGAVTDTTCDIVTSQNGLEGNTVDLGTYTVANVAASALTVDFHLVGKKTDGTNCELASGKSVDISWLPSTGTWATNGLKNAGTAKGVVVGLMDNAGNNFSALKQTVSYDDSIAVAGKLPFKAKIAVDGTGTTIEAGTVISSARFAVAYK
ncbi:fimbrial protein [Vibrio splendidus]|uniref:fimbrial protein n=1 Tax=Vibrio splendidus TaxID=29497 RepID=UPI000769B462|nr:hypothetical protein [Vibrio splendidus]PHX03500.1 Fimbrial protein [Vibrio splendidus]